MAETDDRDPKSTDPRPASPPAPEAEGQSSPRTRATVDVAESKPVSVVVVGTPAAEPVVIPETRVEAPVRVPVRTDVPVEEPPERPRVSSGYLFLVALIIGVLFLSFKNIYQPLMVHVEDSIERHVLGEPSKIYQAPQSNPHTHQQKEKHSLKW